MFTYAEQKPPSAIEKHYTPEALANRLIDLVPLSKNDVVLDPSAGNTNSFFSHFPNQKRALRCELEEGNDFLITPLKYDWAITNPPLSSSLEVH